MTSPSDTPAAPDVGEIIERLEPWRAYFAYEAKHPEEYGQDADLGLLLKEAASALASSAAETARLREERDEANRALDQFHEHKGWTANHVAQRLYDEKVAAEAEKEAMRVEAMKVLDPFAKAARASSVMEGRSGDCYKLAQNGSRIAFMDLRAASALLKALHSQTEGGDDDGK